MSVDERLDEILANLVFTENNSSLTDHYAPTIQAKQQLKTLITESNKAFVLSVLPKKERVSNHPNTYDRKMRSMWNRGFNNAIDTTKKNAGIENV